MNHGNKNPVHSFMGKISGRGPLNCVPQMIVSHLFVSPATAATCNVRLLTVAPTAASPHRDPDGGRSSGALSRRDLAVAGSG